MGKLGLSLLSGIVVSGMTGAHGRGYASLLDPGMMGQIGFRGYLDYNEGTGKAITGIHHSRKASQV